MHHRWIAVSLGAATLFACSDDPTGPGARADTPSLAEYALLLQGDPFLKSVAGMLGHPELANRIDEAFLAFAREPSASTGQTTLLFTGVRASLSAATPQDSDSSQPSENDVLAAVVDVTLDRLAQVEAGSTDTPTDPPPIP